MCCLDSAGRYVQCQKAVSGSDLTGLQQPKINQGVFCTKGLAWTKARRMKHLSVPFRYCCVFNKGHAELENSTVFSGVSGKVFCSQTQRPCFLSPKSWGLEITLLIWGLYEVAPPLVKPRFLLQANNPQLQKCLMVVRRGGILGWACAGFILLLLPSGCCSCNRLS